jgi:hypothetical protein
MVNTQPIGDNSPDSTRVSTFRKQMKCRLQGGSAQRAHRAVVPVPPCEPARGPNSVLEDEPGEEFAFRGCPRLPDARKHMICGDIDELCPISRGGGVVTACCQSPSNLVGLLRL